MKVQTDIFDSPFIAAKREWNERYGDYLAQARNWRAAALLALSVSAILAVGAIWLAAQSKFVPYVVEVDKLGSAVAVAPAERVSSPDATVIRAQLASWITNARMISSDPTIERNALTSVYGLIDVHTKQYLDDYYRTHSPFELAAKGTVTVNVDAVLPQSDKTYQIQWTEEHRDSDGSHPVDTQWEADATIGINPPTDEATLLKNPMGIYITQLSWTQRI